MNGTEVPSFQGTARFAIVRSIGAGGMGVVYEAHDRERDVRVALKTLRSMDAQALYRFKQEFRSLAEIVHPQLIPLFELFSDGEHWFFTMELIEGGIHFLSYLRDDIDNSSSESPGTQDWSGEIPHSASQEKAPETNTADTPPPGRPPENSAEEKSDPAVSSDGGAKTVTPYSWPSGTQQSPSDSGTSPAIASSHFAQKIDYQRLRPVFHQLAEGVAALHAAGKLHRDLKPANVLVRPNGRVVVLDFGLVVELGARPAGVAEKTTKSNPESSRASYHSLDGHIVGTVAYMAPEQAGAQAVTPASDWYAFGVMLFQGLTGRLPFSGKPKDVLRNKQRLDAPAPADLAAGVPEDLNKLCVDLLRRNPADRPTGAEILARLGGSVGADAGLPPSFPNSSLGTRGLGTRGLGSLQSLPFIGREKHLAVLNDVLARMLKGKTAIYHVHGKSGAGKSSLIQHFLDGLSERTPAVILGGKCYEQESVPFKGVDSLVDALTRYLLRLPEAEQHRLIPNNVAALARIFPVLKRVPAVARAAEQSLELPNLVELRNLAFATFRRLLRRIGKVHPLILHIDDLQWGDVDSAALLSTLLQPPDAPRLLLLACYRSEYLESSACLQVLKEAQRAGDATQEWGQLSVDPLSLEETRELAVRLLGDDSPEGHSKADWVVRESRGTVFFAYELVRHLQAGMALSAAEGIDLDEVLWLRIQRLPEEARRLLEVIAVAGQPVRLRNIQEGAELTSLPPHFLMVLRSEHLVRSTGPTLQDEIEAYHDRISESVVSHLSAVTLEGHHLRLAVSLEATPGTDPETVATHFHRGRRRDKACHYYELAAAQAVQALAFDRAEDFYRQAASLAESIQDKARIYEKMIHFYTDLARFADAYSIGRQAVELFGVRLPAKFVPPLFLIDFLRARWRLWGRPVATLLDLPGMDDEERATALRLMTAVGKAAYQIDPRLCIAGSVKSVNMCLKNGNTAESALCYMAFGAIFVGSILGKHQKGYEFGKLALALVDKYQNERIRSEVSFVIGYFATSWLRPAVEAEQLWQIAHDAGLRSGDLFHTGLACCATILSLFVRGVPMQDIMAKSDQFLEFLNRAGLREPSGAIMAVRQTIRNLRGLTRSRDSLSDNTFDEEAYRGKLAGFGSRHLAHYYFIAKMQTLYLWREYDKAFTAAAESAAYLKDSQGMLHSAEHHFYYALILAALYPSRGGWQRISLRRKLQRIHKKMRQWAANCPDNFLHKEKLVAAEIARITGKYAAAASNLAAAVAAAGKYGCLQIEALAHERAARLHQARGDQAAAAVSLTDARACYRRWGANSYAASLPD